MARVGDVRININKVPPPEIQRTYRPRKINFKKIGIFLILAALLALGGRFAFSMIRASGEFSIELELGLNRTQIAEKIGEELGWSKRERQVFASTHAQMQWAGFNPELAALFSKKFGWREAEREG